MKAFRLSGRFLMGRDWQAFSKEVAAEDEAGAREKLLSLFGSQHGVARKYIKIAAVSEATPSELRDSAVRHAVEVGR